MKVVHVNTTDVQGGAALACLGINDSLNKNGVESSVLVQKKYKDDSPTEQFVSSPFQKFMFQTRFFLDYFSIFFLTVQKRGRFSFPYFGTDISKHKLIIEADIIHLHWVNGGFFSTGTFEKLTKLNKPIVWTLHDMWAFTGGCHYSGGCKKYLSECSDCPSLIFRGRKDMSSQIFEDKISAYKNLNLNIVTCSNWLAGEAEKSTLLSGRNIRAIPNAVDTELFKPVDKEEAKKKLGLPADKKMILFGTMTLKEERKGFDYLKKSLNIFKTKYPELSSNAELLVFGASNEKQAAGIPFKTNFLGRISDSRKLALCYAAADVFVAPSLEDNLPNTVMESLSCGSPVAAFNIGGMPDMIDHKKNGYLAEPFSEDDLAGGIAFIIEDKNKSEELSLNARKKVTKNFNQKILAERYSDLYTNILEKQNDI